MSYFIAVLKRDVRLSIRHKSALLPGPAFFALLIILFPLALGPDEALLQITAPAILALAALLASLFPLERLFLSDQEDGSIDLLLTAQPSLLGYVCGKLVAHWVFGGLLLVLLSPFLMLVLGLPLSLALPVMGVLAAMTLCLTLVGGLGAALVTGARQGSILLALLLLPLYIPVLIFGAGTLSLLATGGDAAAPALLLGAILVLALTVVPFLAAAMLKGTQP